MLFWERGFLEKKTNVGGSVTDLGTYKKAAVVFAALRQVRLSQEKKC